MLQPKGGFWRGAQRDVKLRREEGETFGVTTSDVGVFPCPPHACKPGGECAEGREGVVCGICQEGWSMAYGTCTRCEAGSNVTKPILALVLLFLSLVALYFCGYVPIFGPEPHEEEDQEKSGCAALKAKVMGLAGSVSLPFLGWGKIIISFYQVLSSYIVIFPVDWPVGQQSMMENSAVSRFDFMAQPGLNCLAGNYDYTQKTIVYLMSVPTVLFVLTLPTIFVIVVGLAGYGGWNQHPRFQAVIHQFLWMTLFFIFIVYPTVSHVTLRSFACQDLGEFGRRLTADFRENCPKDDRGGFIFVFSLFFSIVYPAGIPLFFLVVMIVYRIPQMARTKMKDAAIAALISEYKRRTAAALTADLQQTLGLKPYRKKGSKNPVEKFSGDLAERENGSDPASQPETPNGNGGTSGRLSKGRRPSTSSRHSEHGSLSASSFKKILGRQADLHGDKKALLYDMIDKHATPKPGGAGEHDKVLDREKLEDLIGELAAKSMFKGMERLDKLSSDQLKALCRFDWLKVKDRSAGAAERRARLGSVEDVGVVSPSTAGGVGYAEVTTPGQDLRSRRGVEKLLRRRGSLFGAGGEPEQPNQQDKWDLLSDEKLKNRVKDIADRLLEARVIAVPHLEWDGGLEKEGWPEKQAIDHIGFLFKNYRVECWYYELLEIVRKLICTAVMGFIFPGSPAQIAVGFAVSFLFLMLAARLNPYVDHRLESMQIWALLALAITLLYGLVLVVQETAPRPLSDGWMSFLDTTFMIMNSSILFYPLFQVYFGSRYAPREYIKRWYRKWLKRVEKHREEENQNVEANLPEERVKPEGRYLESDEPEPTRETRELFHVPVGAPLGHRDDVENGNGNGNGNHYGYDNGNGNGNGNHQIPPPAQPVEISQPTPRREVATADVSTEDVLGAPVQNKGMLNRPSIFGVTIPGLQVDPDQNEGPPLEPPHFYLSPEPHEAPPTLPPGYSEFSTGLGSQPVNGMAVPSPQLSYHASEPLDQEGSIWPQAPGIHLQILPTDSASAFEPAPRTNGHHNPPDRRQVPLPKITPTRLSHIGQPVTVSASSTRTVYSLQDHLNADPGVMEEGHA